MLQIELSKQRNLLTTTTLVAKSIRAAPTSLACVLGFGNKKRVSEAFPCWLNASQHGLLRHWRWDRLTAQLWSFSNEP